MITRTNRTGRTACVWLLVCAAQMSSAADRPQDDDRRRPPLFLTATNGTPNNFLAVVNTRTEEVNYVPTGGSGGAGGNAGGVAVMGRIAAAVNFGSSSVTIFARRGNTMSPLKTIRTASQPVSAAFGHGHLVVLGLTTAESFPVYGEDVGSAADGMAPLLRSDKSAAQIVAFNGGVVYSEKSGSVAQLELGAAIGGGLSGPNRTIALPATPNNDTPFGMIARGDNVYLTIAHSDLEALVTNGKIAATAAGPMPYKDATGNFLHAPCWNAVHGQFLYAADSPGKQLLRYLVSDTNVFFDKSAVARFSGGPTDIVADGDLLGVIDGGDGATSNVSVFDIDSEGGLALRFAVKIPAPINGAAIVP